MKILEEIRECFASTQNGARNLKELPIQYPAMVIRNSEEYGVAIEYNNEKDISEKFVNSRLFTQIIRIGDQEKKYLILSCMVDRLRYEFATVCAQFVDPGIEGQDRANLLNDPISWWKNWCELMGNTISIRDVYSVIGEMMVLENLYKKDNSIEWSAVEFGSHDIESKYESYGASITVSSQHQLKSMKRLYLYFCRLEHSEEGISINDMEEKLIKDGYDRDKIEYQLNQLGYEKGASVREEKYKILEKRKYEVNEKFPKIVDSSFKGDKIPKLVTQITYTIDLDGLEYTVW